MKFSSSLKKNHIFRRLYASKGVANSYFVLYARPNRGNHNYVGITVSKKLGHAVVRNRTRRRIREIYRLHQAELLPGYDMVIVARVKAAHSNYAAMERSFLSCMDKLELRRKENKA